MTITLDSKKLFQGLLFVLLALYGANIFIIGKLSAALIDKPIELSFVTIAAPETDCAVCPEPKRIIDIIDQSHNVTYDTTELDSNSALGQKYIDLYGIENLPAIIVSGDIQDERILGSWKSFGARVEKDRVIIDALVPSYNLVEGKTRGVVEVLLLRDSTCVSCFDEKAYLNILQRFGVVIGKTAVYDVESTEGKELVEKYSIQKVPTMLISPDIDAYQRVMDTWNQVGTIESDNWLILREVQKISPEYLTL